MPITVTIREGILGSHQLDGIDIQALFRRLYFMVRYGIGGLLEEERLVNKLRRIEGVGAPGQSEENDNKTKEHTA